ncbi:MULTISPECIES: RICIN domain-containing protein [Streptomyces]|uniref:RICIN domain-containing protein n=1 Tax=Streptomyces TaxID=1883 RepID=UPI001F0F81D0|nr:MULTISPECIES: RICIN domain-containing protein [Streptomyces]
MPKERYGCLTGAACVRQVGASGLCLAVDEGGTADGADIEQQPYASLTRQQWQIIAV